MRFTASIRWYLALCALPISIARIEYILSARSGEDSCAVLPKCVPPAFEPIQVLQPIPQRGLVAWSVSATCPHSHPTNHMLARQAAFSTTALTISLGNIVIQSCASLHCRVSIVTLKTRTSTKSVVVHTRNRLSRPAVSRLPPHGAVWNGADPDTALQQSSSRSEETSQAYRHGHAGRLVIRYISEFR